ncbi:MAG: phage tail sheath subtilisin-like domain-containing protein [Gallionella sp.]|jgi:phage tail sheath gpL-like
MPDNITFMSIPTDWRVPGAFLEIDHTKAVRGLPSMPRKLLILGQRLTTGSVPAATLTRITRPMDGVNYFGNGSMLAQMIPAALKVHPTADLYAMALDDNVAGVLATGTLTFGGTPTEAGTLNLYIGGTKVQVAIAASAASTAIATAVAAAINANAALPVTATVLASVVTVTARHKGEESNNIDLRLNYYSGEFTPKGMTVAIVAMTGGTANPDVLTAIAAMSSGAFYTIVMPWNDTANITAIENELQGRWGGLDMRTGHCFGFKSGTFAQLASFGTARNSAHDSFPGLNKSPSLPWLIAAQFAAAVERSGANDPAIPFRSLSLPDVMAPAEADRFIDSERNLLLHDGISTIIFDPSGLAMVEQVVTTYQTNTFGLTDVSLLKLNTKWTVDFMRYTFRMAVLRDYPQHKLADDNVLNRIQPGQKITTPLLIRNTLINAAMQLEYVGLLEGLEQFIADLIVVRSVADRNRVNSVIPPNVVNQFDVFAAAVQYIL